MTILDVIEHQVGDSKATVKLSYEIDKASPFTGEGVKAVNVRLDMNAVGFEAFVTLEGGVVRRSHLTQDVFALAVGNHMLQDVSDKIERQVRGE